MCTYIHVGKTFMHIQIDKSIIRKKEKLDRMGPSVPVNMWNLGAALVLPSGESGLLLQLESCFSATTGSLGQWGSQKPKGHLAQVSSVNWDDL